METLKKVKDAYAMKLFENVYQKIFADLLEVDQKYLIAVLGNKQLKEVAAMLHCNSSYASQYRIQIQCTITILSGTKNKRY